MNNKELKKAWKLRLKLRKDAKKLEKLLNNNEVQAKRLYLEALNVQRQIEYENGTYKTEKDKLLFRYCVACQYVSNNLKEECIIKSKNVISNIIESDKIWIDAIIKVYGIIKVEWTYDTDKNDYMCKLKNGEIYLP